MQVTVEQGKLFYRLFSALLGYVNRRLAVIPAQFSDASEYTLLPPQSRGKVRDALYEHRELIDTFVAENPAGLSLEELDIIARWKNALVGSYYIFRHLKKYTIFLSASDNPPKAYGVVGLADPIEHVVGPYLPILCDAVLLPFLGQVIYDGLIAPYSITFGGGVRRSLNQDYNRAKQSFGIITSLDDQPKARIQEPKKAKGKSGNARLSAGDRSGSSEAKAIAEELMKMTDFFCKEFLNEEYAELCRKLAGQLARKRPSPLLKGRLETWASGIVRTVGWVNFLQDPTQTPHLKLSSIDEAFGVSTSTGANRLKTIRTMLKIRQLDPKWTLPSMMDDNPMVWILEVNGFLMDIRSASRELQEVAFEKGLIPYIPANRSASEEE